LFFFFSSRRRHTRSKRDWSSDVCSSDLGWTRFVSMQNQYNLLRRQDEPELMALCADQGVGLVPYSPQGKGRLARPWGEQSLRSRSEERRVGKEGTFRRAGSAG